MHILYRQFYTACVCTKRSYTTHELQHGIILLGQMFVRVLFFHLPEFFASYLHLISRCVQKLTYSRQLSVQRFHRYSTGIAMIYIVQVSYYKHYRINALRKKISYWFQPETFGYLNSFVIIFINSINSTGKLDDLVYSQVAFCIVQTFRTQNPVFRKGTLHVDPLLCTHKRTFSLEQLLIATVKVSRGSSSFFITTVPVFGDCKQCTEYRSTEPLLNRAAAQLRTPATDSLELFIST
jgi:hypothetical protein